jgi:hypothetical protein
MTPTRPGSSAASGVGFAINLDPVPVLGLRVGIGVSGAGWMCVGSRRACGLHRRSLARRYSLRDGAWVSDLELPLAAHHLRGEDLKAVQASQPRGRGTTLLTHLGPPSHRRQTSASYARPQVCSEASTALSAVHRPTLHGEEPVTGLGTGLNQAPAAARPPGACQRGSCRPGRASPIARAGTVAAGPVPRVILTGRAIPVPFRARRHRFVTVNVLGR